jgi:hypothetical protein
MVTLYYWIATNGDSCALCTTPMATSVMCSPTPENLIGFPSFQEASEAQRICLNEPSQDISSYLLALRSRMDVAIVVTKDPEPKTRGTTVWFSHDDRVVRQILSHTAQSVDNAQLPLIDKTEGAMSPSEGLVGALIESRIPERYYPAKNDERSGTFRVGYQQDQVNLRAEINITQCEHQSMTPAHPQWDEFMDRLYSEEGCNFHFTSVDEPKTLAWTCDSSSSFPMSGKILAAMRFSSEEIELSLLYFRQHGGGCDCEIILNCDIDVE